MLLNIIFILLSAFGLHADKGFPFNFTKERELLLAYKKLLVDIREQRLLPNDAKEEFASIMREIRLIYPNKISADSISQMVFPLVSSNVSSVGGKGNGFFARRFNLFDVTINGSHPAHDIFIYDPDQDCRDNRKKEYVDIVSVGNGLVIAVESNWMDGSEYRGGNYVWVYDIERGGLWYYAHAREVVVEPGQIVKPGDKLGQVGRTGFNAKSNRSDTHLHLMYLDLDENYYPKAINYYEWLKSAKTIKKSNIATLNTWKMNGLIGDDGNSIQETKIN